MVQLSKEVQIIIDELKNKTSGEKINEINTYIDENYGKVQRNNLEAWLGENFKLSNK